MSNPWRRVVWAAGSVLATVPFFAAVVFTTPPGLTLQPVDRTLPPAVFFRAAVEAPASSLAFFLADSAFVLAFLWLVLTLARALAPRQSVVRLAVVAALLKALADLGENSLFAAAALQGQAPSDPTLLLLLGDVKRWAAIVSVAALALAYPRDGWRGTGIALLLALAALLGVLGYFDPARHLLHPHALLLTVPLILWDARRRTAT